MIDLHSHTICSDSNSTVEELLKEAERKQLSILSITDHNTVRAYDELKNNDIRNLYSGKIINGVEITTTYNGEVIEILGYNFDLETMKKLLAERFLSFEQKQLKEFFLIRDRYTSIGVKFDINNIIFDPKKETSIESFCNEIKKYPENNKFILSMESINTANDFTRNEVYNPKSSLYVDQSLLYPSLGEVIAIIHQAGGLAFLAHAFIYSSTIAEQLENILKNYKLDGLECYYTTFTRAQSDYLLNTCDRMNLLKSGGSDFHGTRKNNHYLGTGDGNLLIDESLVANWLNNR